MNSSKKRGKVRLEVGVGRVSLGKEGTSFSGCHKEAVASLEVGSIFLSYSTLRRYLLAVQYCEENWPHTIKSFFFVQSENMFSTESKTKRNECQSRFCQRKLPILSLLKCFLKRKHLNMVAVVQLWAWPHVFTDGLNLITLESYISGSKHGMCEGQTNQRESEILIPV